MTENEAVLNRMKQYRDYAVNELNMCGEMKKDFDTAIQALEEIQQYHAIGALEEIKKVISFLSNDNDNSVIDDMNVLNAYRSIGTIEEFKALKEKAEPKKPILRKDGTYDCVCGNAVIKTDCYCEDCGQKLDWSEEE